PNLTARLRSSDAMHGKVSDTSTARRAKAVRPLSACFELVDSPAGRRRLADYLKSQPFPHYKPIRNFTRLMLRIDANGKGTVVRFINGKFRAVKPRARK